MRRSRVGVGLQPWASAKASTNRAVLGTDTSASAGRCSTRIGSHSKAAYSARSAWNRSRARCQSSSGSAAPTAGSRAVDGPGVSRVLGSTSRVAPRTSVYTTQPTNSATPTDPTAITAISPMITIVIVIAAPGTGDGGRGGARGVRGCPRPAHTSLVQHATRAAQRRRPMMVPSSVGTPRPGPSGGTALPTPTVLISGASIAGPALAYWLTARAGRPPSSNASTSCATDGQNIDVRGAGREVARRMGIEDAIRAASTGETGTEFVDADGTPLARFAAGESDSGGATAELEILRGQLSRIIVDRTRDDTEYVFGDRIVALDDSEDGVTVTFARRPTRTFDLVVVAEGLRSRTGRLVFPGSTPCANSTSTSPT